MKKISHQHSGEPDRGPQPIQAKQRHDSPEALAGFMKFERLSKADIVYAISLTIASLIAYVITYYAFEPFVNQTNDFLGGMWATVATVFVFREAKDRRLRAGIARFFATCVSFVLTLVYLLFLPFSPVGMAVIIGIGAVIVTLLGRRDDVVTTGITTAVIMVVAGMGPASQGWTIPLLRLLDTVVGIVVGVGCCEVGRLLLVSSSRFLHYEPSHD